MNRSRDARSPSETEVAATIKKLVKAAKGRVAVTTFASNVARVRAVADAANAADREVVVVGRAMERVVQVARECGYLDGSHKFRSADYYGHFPPDKVLALCTGSQGEPRAALARIANNDHPQVTLNRGDTVIFSSRTIPGNEKAVGGIINGLVTQGVEIITDREHLVHVSGHPRRDELRDMISWVRPQLLIPVHGEALHLAEHAKLARAAGVPKVLTCRNGDLVKLGPGDPGIVGEVPSGRLYKDGTILEDSKSRAVVERYGGREVPTLRFIRCARDLGFGIEEIRTLLALWQDRGRPSREVKCVALAHAADLQRRIDELQAMQRTLTALAGCCHGDQRADCPILDDLEAGPR